MIAAPMIATDMTTDQSTFWTRGKALHPEVACCRKDFQPVNTRDFVAMPVTFELSARRHET